MNDKTTNAEADDTEGQGFKMGVSDEDDTEGNGFRH